MLVDDQIEEKEAGGALDELSKRINRKPSKDIVAGINVTEKFQEDFQVSLAKEEVVDSKKVEQKVDQAVLLTSIRSDMGEGR